MKRGTSLRPTKVRERLEAGILDRTEAGHVIFPFDAVHVDFTVVKAA